MEEQLEYRMYGLVPYNLSPIQQGIQYGHAVVEHMINNPMILGEQITPLYKWAKHDKTFIILNGGTTNLGHKGYKGSLNSYIQDLSDNKINYSTFHEPDLGDQLTAIVFLVDERVWDKEKYPDFIDESGNIHSPLSGNWSSNIGGPQNVFLREFLKQFILA